MKTYTCVDKGQKEVDMFNADWRHIKAKSVNQAKWIYSKLANTEYKDCLCWVGKKKF